MPRRELGDRIYIWTAGPQPARSAVISAHGDCLADANSNAMPRSSSLPPMLHYLTPHGHVLNDPGIAQFSGKDIVPVESMIASKSPDYTLSKYTNSKDNETWIHKHNDNNESYPSIARSLLAPLPDKDQSIQSALAYAEGAAGIHGNPNQNTIDEFRKSAARMMGSALASADRMDVITIRSRMMMSGSIKLSEILRLLDEHQIAYADIYCAFCRGPAPSP